MADEQIIVIDKIEEAEDNKGKTYFKITDKAGTTRNFKEGRNNLLTNKGHLLKEGVAIKLHFQDYKTPDGRVFPFVKDFEPVEDVFVAQAAEKVQGQVKTERNDSIEAQVAFKGMVELLIADKFNNPVIEQAIVDWAMARIALPSVIVEKIEEAKGEKTNTDNKATDQQQGEERTTRPASGETLELLPGETERVKGFLEELVKHDIKAPRLFLKVEYAVPEDAPLSDTQCELLYQTIKTKMKW